MRPSFAADGIHAVWDPSTRTFDCRFAPDAAPLPARAAEISAWTRSTAGDAPYAILMDATHSHRLSTAFRASATRHLLAQRDLVRVACYGLDPPMHAFVVLVTRITRANVRAFTERDEAMRWLAGGPTPLTPPAATA